MPWTLFLFPSLRDQFSTKGYEHFYVPEKGTEFISWCLKTLSRKNPKRVCLEMTESGGPSRRRIDDVQQLEGDACRESCTSIEGRLGRREDHQPFLLRSGRSKGRINHFYVVVDKRLIPCVGTSSLSAFELFKVHYVFNLSYDEALVSKANSLFYRPFDLQCLYGSDDGEYMVPFFLCWCNGYICVNKISN